MFTKNSIDNLRLGCEILSLSRRGLFEGGRRRFGFGVSAPQPYVLIAECLCYVCFTWAAWISLVLKFRSDLDL